jgi:hypothetical protein
VASPLHDERVELVGSGQEIDMKFKALVTSLLLASSTVALADDYSTTNFVGDRYGDRTDQRGSWRRRPNRLTWQPLTQMITAQRANVIRLDERKDDLHAIRLQNGSGATYVYSLTLRYDDGSRENVTVAKWLYAGVPLLTFDLPQGRGGVSTVTINTWTYAQSTYQVLGQLGRNSVDHPPGEQPFPTPPPLPPITQALTLGTNLTFAGSAGYVHIPVGAEKGSFGKLDIKSAGSTFLGRVYVTFPGGQYQTFEVNKALYSGQSISLDIQGDVRQIAAVTVMAGDDFHAIGQTGSRFSLALR